MIAFVQIAVRSLADLVGLAVLAIRPRWSLEAENLVLRRQLGLFKERGVKPRRIDAGTRISLTLLSRFCDWRTCLMSGNHGSLAPRRMATALALQVAPRPPAHSVGTSPMDSTMPGRPGPRR